MKKQIKQPLDIRIGEKMLVDVEGTGKRFWTEAYGMVHDKYLLLRHPMNVTFKDLLNQDQPITARYMDAQGSIYGFKSTVVATIPRPAAILVITHPFMIESVNLRRYDRVQCFLPATLFHEGQELAGYIVNLSAGGAKFVRQVEEGKDLDLPKNSEAFCQYSVPGVENCLYARSIIKSTTQVDTKVVIGLKFEDLEEDSNRIITEYVQQATEFMVS